MAEWCCSNPLIRSNCSCQAHIKPTDPVTPETNRHLLRCEECQQVFPMIYRSLRRRVQLGLFTDVGPDVT